jgi:uncharacterized YccA/Bax inhibitor family protein
MSNPVFDNNAIFRDPKKARRQQTQQSARQPGMVQDSATTATVGYDTDALNRMYGAPSATTAQTGRLTYDDVIMKTGGLLAVVVVMAALTWFVVPDALKMPVLVVGALVGFVLGMVNSFKKVPSPALIVAYSVAEGAFLGGISWYFETAFHLPGLVMQAVLATMSTFAACLVLFRSGKVRVTPKFTKWLLIAMVGYLVFSVLNFVLSMLSVGGDGAFGPLRSGPMGILIGLFAVGLAAAMLIVDFDSIKRGVDAGVPARFAWTAAFGLVVTLVWMYLEFLRLIAILRGSN